MLVFGLITGFAFGLGKEPEGLPVQERAPGLSETATASQPCPARTSEKQFLPRELQKAWETAVLQLHRDRLLLRTAQAEGLTPRKAAEGPLTCCTPGKGVKGAGSPDSRPAAGGEEWDSPSLPGAARHPAARETGILKRQRNRAQPPPSPSLVSCTQDCQARG